MMIHWLAFIGGLFGAVHFSLISALDLNTALYISLYLVSAWITVSNTIAARYVCTLIKSPMNDR